LKQHRFRSVKNDQWYSA